MFVFMISRSSSKLGHLGSKPRSAGQISRKPCYTLAVTFFKQSSWILLKMFVLMISRSSSKLGHLVYSNDDSSFALTYLQGQFRSLRLLYDKKAKQWMSSWLELKVSVGVYRIVSGPLSVFIGVVIVNTWFLVSVVAHGPLVSYFFPENRISFFMQNSQKIWFNISWGLKLGHVGSKTRSLGQISRKPC